MIPLKNAPTAKLPVVKDRNNEAGEARIRLWLLGILSVVGPIALLLFYYKLAFPGLTNPDALDFAQIGRNLAAGRGFTTFFLRPLALTHGNNAFHQPDVVHGPLFPLFLAIAFAVLGARDSVAAGVSGLFFLFTIPAVFVLGKRVFGQRIGVLSALVFTLNGLSLDYAISGLNLTLCIFLATCLLLAVFHIADYARTIGAGQSPRLPSAALAMVGLIAGLLYLADPIFFWILPVIVSTLTWVMPARRWQAALCLLLPAIIVVGPWMLRNAMLTGNPVFGLQGAELWMNTSDNFPGLSAYRMVSADVFARPGLLQDVVRKVASGIGTVLDSWPNVGGNWVLVFFLPSLFFRFTDGAANSLRRIVLYNLIAVTFGMLLFHIQMSLLVAFVPGMLVFAIAYLVFLVEQARLGRGATLRLTALLTVVLLYPLFKNLALNGKPMPIPERDAVIELSSAVRPDAAVLTDQPWTVAWYANRPAILLPLSETRVADIRGRFVALHWLFLSGEAAYSGPQWKGLYQGLMGWNVRYARARTNHERLPDALRIEGTSPPLLAALNGFVTYPPSGTGTPPTTVAAYSP